MTFTDCYYMGHKPPKTAKEFLEDYKRICKRYNMYIGVAWGEVPSEAGMTIEDACSTQELEEHFEELKEKS